MESINPNDIMSLDMEQISYVTLKNGDMILIDDSIPQKSNKEKKEIPKFSDSGTNEPKKEVKLEISSPSIVSFEGKLDNNKYKSNFKIGSKIIKNTNFSFNGKKSNNNSSKTVSSFNNTKENKDKNNYNSDRSIKGILKNNNFNNNINNDFQTIKNVNENNENDINIGKLDYNQNNLNTNLSIPLMNFTNNTEEQNNINTNRSNRRKSRASRIFGIGEGPLGKKSNIKINAVCSLNIRAEEKTNINLVSQFNSLVDKLNAERGPKPIYEHKENFRDNSITRYYELYKDKTNNTINKNMETLQQNFIGGINNEHNIGINLGINYKTLNNLNKRSNRSMNRIDFNNSSMNKNFNHNYRETPNVLPSRQIKKFKNRINKYSSWLVLPSNNMGHYK